MTGRLLISEWARAQLVGFADASAPNETGGVLLGYLGDGDPWVTRVVEISMTSGRRSTYLIPAGATRSLVEQLVQEDPRIGYVGDWHTHPQDQTASPTDRATLRLLTFGRLLHRRRVMVIVRLATNGWIVDAWRRRGVREVVSPIVLTGPP